MKVTLEVINILILDATIKPTIHCIMSNITEVSKNTISFSIGHILYINPLTFIRNINNTFEFIKKLGILHNN